MNCKEWEDRLALYLSADLPGDEADRVERHLSECPGCQVFASGLRAAQELLQEAHREEVAPVHYAALRARVLSELERRRLPWWRRGWIYGLAAAGVVLAVLAIRPALEPEIQPPAVARAHPPSPVLRPRATPAAVTPTAPVTVVKATTRLRRPGEPGEPVLVRMVSDDPDVVIYWIAETRGE